MRIPAPILVALVLTPLILGAAMWLFFVTHDPMLLIFGVMLTVIAWAALTLVWLARRSPSTRA